MARAVVVETYRQIRDDRITGLGAEFAFFALLSLPPALLVLAGMAGYVGQLLGHSVRDAIQNEILSLLGAFLRSETMNDVVRPAVEGVFARGRSGVLTLGGLLGAWSASRMTKVLIVGLNIAYGVRDWRPAWRRRLLAFVVTVAIVLVTAILVPFLVAGPRLAAFIARPLGFEAAGVAAWKIAYWPLVSLTVLALLSGLYQFAPNWKMRWIRQIPGALLAGGLWVLTAAGVRTYSRYSLTVDAFGPLAAPAVILLWLYASGLAVLAGAELNHAVNKIWPDREAHMKRPPAPGGRAFTQAGSDDIRQSPDE